VDAYFDLRSIREEAYREATQGPYSAARKQPRPFYLLVSAQQDKYKRDKSLRDRLSKEKRQEQHKQEKRDEYLNKAMHVRRTPNSGPKYHRTKKSSVSSAFMQFMRPISSAFTSESATPATKRTPAGLDFTPIHKPAMVLNIGDARVSAFINNERSFTFQLDTEDGGHYLLQTMDKGEMKKWMDTIDRVSKTAAKRRLTYMGQHSKVHMSDHLLGTGDASRNPKAGTFPDCLIYCCNPQIIS
jgi:GTPase-activating protein BEM2